MTHRRKLIWGVVIALVVLPIVVPTFTLNRAKQRILSSLQAALGRRVSADSVHLVLFPWPGFELDRVRLAEDPAFGQEDMATAWDARATLRLWSLVSGKLEFSSIRLDYPNINLVRNGSGEWNFAALLDRARQSTPPLRSTEALPSLGHAIRFPYLELDHGRVNFKFNDEKTRLYLGNVEGTLALNGNRWRVHLRFEPMRNDLNLSDTGTVVVDGHWQAGNIPFRKLPFDLSAHVENSYLAASSALFAGHDAGVHGIVSAEMRLEGTGDQFQLSGAVHADSVRRWDMLPPQTTMDASFLATYHAADDTLFIQGLGDKGMQHLRISGPVRQFLTNPQPDLTVQLNALPARSLLAVARAVKGGLPGNLDVNGSIDGTATLVKKTGKPLSGSAQINLTHLSLTAGRDQLQSSALNLQWDGQRLTVSGPPMVLQRAAATSHLTVSAQVDPRDFLLRLQSPDLVAPASAALAHLWAMRDPWFHTMEGTAALNLSLSADWSQYRQPAWRGLETFKTAIFHPESGSSIPLRDVSVHFAAPEPTRVQFVAEISHDAVTGWVQLPPVTTAGLSAPPQIPPQFGLKAAHLPVAALWNLLAPQPQGSLLDRVLKEMRPSFLAHIQAAGDIDVSDLDWYGYHVALHAQVQAHGAKWSVPLLQLRLGGGQFSGSAELAQGVYSISGQARNIHVAQLLAHSGFAGHADGLLQGTLQLVRPAGSGLGAVQASGSMTLRNGWIAGLQKHSVARQPFSRLATDFLLRNGTVQLEDVLLDQPAHHALRGTGSIHLAKGFDLQLQRKGEPAPVHLTGSFGVSSPPRALPVVSQTRAHVHQ